MERPTHAGAHAPGALAGLRVIDLSRVLAGPLCTQMLSDHGADIIKIEPPSGDETRSLGPPFDKHGDAAYFTAVNRGKRAMAMNLADPAGRDTLFRLIEDADVLIENFVPGTMARWGLDYEASLKPRFPRLIYCAVTGFGADGPLGGLPGYDAVLQAMCGLMSVNGDEACGPTRIGVPIVDHLTAYVALTGILMALNERHVSGHGQRVEATLFDTAMSLLVPHAANWMYSGAVPGLLGSAHPNIAPYDKFACADGLVFLGILNDRQFMKFCRFVGMEQLAEDARFATNAARLQHRTALSGEIEAALSGWSRDALCAQLMRIGVPIGPVNTVPEAFAQAHAAHRGACVEMGAYRGIGLPAVLSRTPGSAKREPPRFGEHASQILGEAGFSELDVRQLMEQGVLHQSAPP
ncbi:crotonobetainyl-CoA:carnitine CoA-transferase CaiB-like acyl-CoA transferase [Pseudorhodoferax soli]|uniref:Crotonobetainyl-CoA:carnitine CoA-transferase CaiB-like acyl-CoA transferase n=2 Tax=Pseudorhodoferax soli TaxID=545864 RepID=A0A368X9F9_9BURK|nr:crotonobetainyl-CoA:carnitine CoA-transferase CaiB-like acyl-CoA transferase [Pseudorhodoferax soli]